MDNVNVLEINNENLDREGSFCLRSKPKSSGYQNKNNWLKESFQEGLRYLKLMENGKPAGFIEYTPIEHSSRVVYGENYYVIHCLWVSVTGKGYASRLIQECIQNAREQNKAGVLVITNPNTSWTPGKDVFLKNNFKEIDAAPYGFELLVHKFDNTTPAPYFPKDWDLRLKRFDNLTILRTHQCPFVDIATENLEHGASKLGIQADIIDLKNREELLELSPTPYGIFGAIYKGKLITFHRLTVHSAIKRLKALS